MPITALTSLTTVPFVQLATGASTGLDIIRIELTQSSSTTSAQTVVTLQRRTTASTLPTTVTPAPLSNNDAAAITASTIGIATATGTAGTLLFRWGFNVLNGLLYVPVPEERPAVPPSSWITLQFPNTPPAVTWEGHIVFQENV